MAKELVIQTGTLRDPQSVQEISGRYQIGENLKPGEIMTISHLLPKETRAAFMAGYGQEMAGIWEKHMPGRFKFYEPMVDNLTE
jgi:hypothetical protein